MGTGTGSSGGNDAQEPGGEGSDKFKNWSTGAAIFVSAVGLFIPLLMAAQAAERDAEKTSYTQRADMYRGYLAAASAFDISAGHFICLAKGRTPSAEDTASAFKELTDAYKALSSTAWNIEFSASGVSNDVKGRLRSAKEKIAVQADQVYGDISKGRAAAMSPTVVDSEISTAQNDFARYARSDLDGTSPGDPRGPAGGTLGCPE